MITNTMPLESPGDSDSMDDTLLLRLYVAGQTPKSILAIKNLRRICDEHLQGRCTVEVIDLVKTPQRAKGDQILAIPTLVRQIPAPFKRIIGDLSNIERVLVGLDIVDADGKYLAR